MQKTTDVLLILAPAERDAAKDFIERRFRTVDPSQVSDIQNLIRLARQQVETIQRDKERQSAHPTRTGQVMLKLYNAALSGLSDLIQECNRSIAAKEREKKEQERAKASLETSSSEPPEDAGALHSFLLPVEPEEEKHAAVYLRGKIENLELEESKHLRDICHEMLTWWSSERGQAEGLLVRQYGDIRTSKGRMAVRQKREDLRRDILNPFRAFFQELNMQYQKLSKEAAMEARKQQHTQHSSV